ncbi:hypothetical protein LBMAG53_16040 [Planctomycetota bacterium]|nr:hypothetical protein LBMAG53_16040 [Planctomycetota bacterium]
MPTLSTVDHSRLLDAVIRSLRHLFKIGSGRGYHGLFPSLVDLDKPAMLYGIPPCVGGQRSTERSPFGVNLIHDQTTLRLAYELGQLCDQPDLIRGADAYLSYFARYCTNTPTGLFPWGEHAFWDLVHRRPGASHWHVPWLQDRFVVYDHQCQVPGWLWDKLWQFNPECVIRHAEGLDWHWQVLPGPDGKRTFCRHAFVVERQVYGPNGGDDTNIGYDFPRHAGFFLVDLAHVYRHTRRDDMRARFVEWAEYHWQRRDRNGLLWMLGHLDPCCTLSLGVSLLDATELIKEADPALAALWRERAERYLDAFLTGSHDPAAGRVTCDFSDDPTKMEASRLPVLVPRWTGNAFGPAATIGLLCFAAWRHTGRADLRRFALDLAQHYAGLDLPEANSLPARDVAQALLLFADAFELTGEERWRQVADRWLVQVEKRFFDRPLVRAWTGLDYYESHQSPGLLLIAVARLVSLLGPGFSRPVSPDYTRR